MHWVFQRSLLPGCDIREWPSAADRVPERRRLAASPQDARDLSSSARRGGGHVAPRPTAAYPLAVTKLITGGARRGQLVLTSPTAGLLVGSRPGRGAMWATGGGDRGGGGGRSREVDPSRRLWVSSDAPPTETLIISEPQSACPLSALSRRRALPKGTLGRLSGGHHRPACRP